MNIVFITSSSTRSGGARQALYLARELKSLGHDLRFFIPENATLPELDPTFPFDSLPKNAGEARLAVEACFAGDQTTIVHAFHNKAGKRLAWWGLHWRRSRSAVALAHRGVIFRPGNPLPYWSPGMDAYTVNSEACGRVLASIGTPRRKIHVVYNAIPRERITPRLSVDEARLRFALPSDKPIVGCVAGDNPVKGCEYLLRGFAQVGSQAVLAVAGATETKWGALRDELGLQGKAFLLGRVDHVADLLQLFDLFALPSVHMESMPNTLLEAVCCGLPAVATDVGGVREIMSDNGLLIPKADPSAIAQAVEAMLEDDEKRATCAAASKRMSERFTMERRTQTVLGLYDELLKRRGLGAA